MFKSKIMPSVEEVKQLLQIPLQDIKLATNGFADDNFIAKGGFGCVYKGVSETHGPIAVKRLDRRQGGQGEHEFKTEIALLSEYKHENIVSLVGFCEEYGEKVLVYKYESNGSLDKHLNSKDLTWVQRIQICLDVALGLKYLHDDVGPDQHRRIIHRDVKSSNILLDNKWKAKISDFGLSRPLYSQGSFVISDPCGTRGYIDPKYYIHGYLTPNSDVYSFGVVLWEVLCGRLCAPSSYNDDRLDLTILAKKHYTRETLDEIIPSYLYNQMNKDSLLVFSNIAYQCLKNGEERPTMKDVMEQLQKALHHQQQHEDVKKSDEVVLSLFMHCEDCARKVKKCLKGFEGVEDVVTYCETHKVVVKGEKTDPLKVLKKVQEEIHREVKLLSPVPKMPVKEPNKPEQEEEPTKQEEKKDELPSVNTVVLKIHMDCNACARKIKKCIKMKKGVESVVLDLDNSQVEVKGTFSAAELVDHVHKKTNKKAVIVAL